MYVVCVCAGKCTVSAAHVKELTKHRMLTDLESMSVQRLQVGLSIPGK